MDKRFEQMDVARHLLPPPGAEAVGECLKEIYRLTNQRQALAKLLLRALVALAKRNLLDDRETLRQEGKLDHWPGEQEWTDLVGSSQSIFLRRAREEAGIDENEYLEAYLDDVRDGNINIDDVWDEICS